MKSHKLLRPLIAVFLCIIGFALARITPYREGTVMLEAGGCGMVTNLIDKGNDETSGSVILFHGLSANKKLMDYMARSFADENLRVFVPDFPGHGRTPGPFSFSRAETCAEMFTRQLIGRRAIDPARTILAGHSMGGAIAIRLAARIPVAGVVAISPAPMSTRHGIARYFLPFENAASAPQKTLVISGSWEPGAVRETAHDVIEGPSPDTNKYVLIPHATHVSLLFDPRAAAVSEEWAAADLGLTGRAAPASLLPALGSLVGFVGILLLAGPFLRETLGAGLIRKAALSGNAGVRVAPTTLPEVNAKEKPRERPTRENGVWGTRVERSAGRDAGGTVTGVRFGSTLLRAVIQTVIACIVAVAVLHSSEPLSFVRLFDGGYFAGFLFIAGGLLLVMRHRSVVQLVEKNWRALIAAALAALLLHLLVSVWFDATLSESWVTWFRWMRFPALLIACLPYFAAEELLLIGLAEQGALARNLAALGLRGIGWLAMLFAIFVLHRGPILLLLLAPYVALFCMLQLAGMQLVRTQTGSRAATALFGAILLAGFCLVIFPVT